MPTAPLSHKERLRRALRHEPVDRLPTQINYTARMGEKMAAYFGVAMKIYRCCWITTWCGSI